MVRTILLGWAVLAVAMALTSAILPGFDVDEGIINYLIVALLFGLVNAIIGPIARLLTLPISVLTLGLFTLVVNGGLLAFTAWLTPLIDVDGLLSAIVAAIVISIISTVVAWLLGWGRSVSGAQASNP